MQKKNIIVGLSGGVDSAVCACLLKQQGHHVTGVFMQNWDDETSECTSTTDKHDVKTLCSQLDIPFHAVNFSQDYMNKVFVKLLDGLKKGHTPNPDILCNQEIKFKVLMDYARQKNADYLATGHYAKITQYHHQAALVRSIDDNKDQTYFLSRMPREALQHVLFPIGEFKKSDIRDLAQQFKLEVANKKDSTGICFIGERKFNDFISEYLLDRPGDIIDINGNIIGRHKGLFYYTIGQRKGLNIGGNKNYKEQPWFVMQKNIKTNQIVVVQGEQNPYLYQKSLRANQLHWLIDPNTLDTSKKFLAQAQIRHRQTLQKAVIEIDKTTLLAQFENAQRAVTPGQSIAIYLDNVCIASAIITED